MDKLQMEQGKIYFISFGANTQLVVRFKKEDACNYHFYDHLHYWNRSETFYKRDGANYCVKSGIEEIRKASLIEKNALLNKELEYGCI